jgi:5-methylcytosine-specific restriction protein A
MKPRRIKPQGLFTWEKSGTEVTDMPYKPKVPCRHPGCPNLVPAGQKYCEEHKRMHPEEIRSAAARGYNSRWRRESKKFLALHPLCEECLRHGIATPATVVDHIVPHRGDPKLFWDRSNWQALCKRCHDKKTGREDSHPVYHF